VASLLVLTERRAEESEVGPVTATQLEQVPLIYDRLLSRPSWRRRFQ
jgi:hypothetical protein